MQSAGSSGDREATGGYVRLTSFPGLGRAWWWVYLVVPGIGLVAVRDHEVPLPHRSDFLEIRADALWAELVCETPFEHWAIGAEAFGLRLDDPLEVLRNPGREERGERLAVGLDLEWELIAPVAEIAQPRGPDTRVSIPSPSAGRYSQAGTVHGTVLIGPDEVRFDGFGVRDHTWGVPGAPVRRIRGASATAAFELTASPSSGPESSRASNAGWSWAADDPFELVVRSDVTVTTEIDGHGAPLRACWTGSPSFEVVAEVDALTVVPVGLDRPPTRRALCALAGDPAWAWAEWTD